MKKRETIRQGIKETVLTDVEWEETVNLYGDGMIDANRPVYRSRPPASCIMVKNYSTNEFLVYSVVRGEK